MSNARFSEKFYSDRLAAFVGDLPDDQSLDDYLDRTRAEAIARVEALLPGTTWTPTLVDEVEIAGEAWCFCLLVQMIEDVRAYCSTPELSAAAWLMVQVQGWAERLKSIDQAPEILRGLGVKSGAQSGQSTSRRRSRDRREIVMAIVQEKARKQGSRVSAAQVLRIAKDRHPNLFEKFSRRQVQRLLPKNT